VRNRSAGRRDALNVDGAPDQINPKEAEMAGRKNRLSVLKSQHDSAVPSYSPVRLIARPGSKVTLSNTQIEAASGTPLGLRLARRPGKEITFTDLAVEFDDSRRPESAPEEDAERFTLADAFSPYREPAKTDGDWSEASEDRRICFDLERGIRAIAFLLDGLTGHGNDPLDPTTALGLSSILAQQAGTVELLAGRRARAKEKPVRVGMGA
jgi:hypothetical protein